MNKSDLKRRLKPIIKECINEVLLEQGLLSSVISEVVRGLAPLQTQVPPPQSAINNNQLREQKAALLEQKKQFEEERLQSLKEQKRKLLDAAGFQTNVFEGVQPLPRGGSTESSGVSQAGALSGVDPSDAGVDIAGIMALGGRDWKKML